MNGYNRLNLPIQTETLFSEDVNNKFESNIEEVTSYLKRIEYF